jgi:hypothetical protein
MLRNSIDMAIGLEIWLLIPKWGVNGPEVTKRILKIDKGVFLNLD